MDQSDYEQLIQRFRRFASLEARGSSPLYERLSRELAGSGLLADVYDGVEPWQQRPNLLLAALHALVLAGTDHDLACYYPSVGGTKAPDDWLIDAVADFVRANHGQLRAWMAGRSTQTNEVRRSAIVLAALNQVRWQGPVALVDVGAAAGLNLLLDRYGYRYGAHHVINGAAAVQIECTPAGGEALPRFSPVSVAERAGIDLNPLRVTDPDDLLWLRACIWPEHRDRRELLDAAVEEARREPPPMVRGDAVRDLARVVTGFPERSHVALFHCATLAYMPADERERFARKLEELAQQRALAWVPIEGPFVAPYDSLDRDHPTAPPVESAYFTVGLTEWAGGQRRDRLLARADPHGAWMQWLAP